MENVWCFWFSTSLPKAYFLAAVYFVCDVWQCLAPHFGGFSSRLTTSFCSIDGTPKCKALSSYLFEQPMLSVLHLIHFVNRNFLASGSCQGLSVDDKLDEDSARQGGRSDTTPTDVGIGFRTIKPSSVTSNIQAGVGNVNA